MKPQIACLLAGLMVGFVLAVAMSQDPAWYRYLIPGVIYLACWIISRNRPFFLVLQLMCGLVAAIAVWPVSLFAGIILVWLIFGIFLLQNNVLKSGEDWSMFILYAGLTALTGVLVYLFPHTITTTAGVITGAGCVLAGMQIAMYRLSCEFRGDHQ